MTDKMREEFESWALSYAERRNYQHMKNVTAKFPDGSYTTTWVDSAWIGWQASRAAMCVELPKPEYSASCSYSEESVKESLDAAGVRYK